MNRETASQTIKVKKLNRCASTPLWKVMEFHMKATVGALFIFIFSDRVCLLSHLHSAQKLCIVLSFVFLFSSPCFPSFPLSFSDTLMFSVVFLPLLFSLCSIRSNSPTPSCCADKWTMICLPRTPGNRSRLMTMYSLWLCVCVCVCAHAKQLGPLRALCLPVSFCYWCHISPGTHTTSSQLLVMSFMCVTATETKHM